jgi:hypothetical protein
MEGCESMASSRNDQNGVISGKRMANGFWILKSLLQKGIPHTAVWGSFNSCLQKVNGFGF